jgi:tetratricopeptide (TPR) repeat protein
MADKIPLDPELIRANVRKAMDEADVNGIGSSLRLISGLERSAGNETILREVFYPETLLFYMYVARKYPSQCLLAGLDAGEEIKKRKWKPDPRLGGAAPDQVQQWILQAWDTVNEAHLWVINAEKEALRGNQADAGHCFGEALKLWAGLPEMEQKSFSTMAIIKTWAMDRTAYCRWLKEIGSYDEAIAEYKATGAIFRKLTLRTPRRSNEYARYLSGYASALALSGDNMKALMYYCKAETLWEMLLKRGADDGISIDLALCYNNHVLSLARIMPEVSDEHLNLLKKAYKRLSLLSRTTTESRLFLVLTLQKWALFLLGIPEQAPGLPEDEAEKFREEACRHLLEAEANLSMITDYRERDYYSTYIEVLELILNDCGIKDPAKRGEFGKKLEDLRREWKPG